MIQQAENISGFTVLKMACQIFFMVNLISFPMYLIYAVRFPLLIVLINGKICSITKFFDVLTLGKKDGGLHWTWSLPKRKYTLG